MYKLIRLYRIYYSTHISEAIQARKLRLARQLNAYKIPTATTSTYEYLKKSIHLLVLLFAWPIYLGQNIK